MIILVKFDKMYLLIITFVLFLNECTRTAKVQEPLIDSNEHFDTIDDYPFFLGEDGARQKRMANFTRSRIVEAMLKTPMIYLNSAEPDPLSFLRDQYDLPKGKKLY